MGVDHAGRFIVLEGPDGGGKTTQAARLVSWLRSFHPEVVACRDPGGTPLGDHLRGLLKDRSDIPLTMRAEMFLFMASRAQLVQDVIAPALDRGAIVVCDRFVLSNVVYQGHAGGLDPEAIWACGELATGGLRPDLTVFIDAPSAISSGRIAAGRDRIEDRGPGYRERVERGYAHEVPNLPNAHAIIDGRPGVDEVELQIRREVSRALGIGPRA